MIIKKNPFKFQVNPPSLLELSEKLIESIDADTLRDLVVIYAYLAKAVNKNEWTTSKNILDSQEKVDELIRLHTRFYTNSLTTLVPYEVFNFLQKKKIVEGSFAVSLITEFANTPRLTKLLKPFIVSLHEEDVVIKKIAKLVMLMDTKNSNLTELFDFAIFSAGTIPEGWQPKDLNSLEKTLVQHIVMKEGDLDKPIPVMLIKVPEESENVPL